MITETTVSIDNQLALEQALTAPATLEAPKLLADWRDAVFIHHAVDPALLQPHVPFPLDLHEGKAYVSLVAFTQHRLRPTWAGTLVETCCRPLATHPFLNVRTYVRHGRDCGIYFLAEWIPNRLAALIGPRLYGLPYRLGQLQYANTPAPRQLSGHVVSSGGAELRYEGTIDPAAPLAPARQPLDHFLLERYVAFTHRRGKARGFRIAHEPWLQTRATIRVEDRGLLAPLGEWSAGMRPVAAHYSPGLRDVRIGAPWRTELPGDRHAFFDAGPRTL